MELRADKACLNRKLSKLEKDNKILQSKVETLDQKCIEDDDLIIDYIKS